eukprot:c25664_g1_i1 orf=73-726(+)
MASRGFNRLRALWATCQGAHLQHHARSSCSQQTRVLSAQSKVFCPQSMLFSAQFKVSSPQFRVFSAHPRAFSVQAAEKEPASTAEGEGGENAAVKKKRKRKKTFMEVAQFLPDWGLGAKFTKSHWPPGNFYKVTKVKVYKSGRHGAAWGVFHQEEVAKTGETQKIGGVNKRCWRYVPEGGVAAVAWKRPAAERPIKPVPLTIADIATLSPSTPQAAV